MKLLSFYDVMPEQVNGFVYDTLTTTLQKYNAKSLVDPLPGNTHALTL